MNKHFLGVILGVVAILLGVFLITGGNDNGSGGNGSNNSDAQPSNHITGAESSSVKLVEYGDFQCPACKSYHPILQQLKAEYGDRVAFQFRHFPLTQIHPNAFIASRAAEAAGMQGKFFEFHDLLYENQESWSSNQNPSSIFEGYARQLNLDIEKFNSDRNSATVADTINADVRAAQAIGASSTPTFVLNERKLDQNPTSLDEFKKLLDEELGKTDSQTSDNQSTDGQN